MEGKINKKIINLILILIFLLLVIFFLEYTKLLSKIKDILIALIPFYIGFFLSWVLTPVAQFINKTFKINIKISNIIALVLSIVLLLIFTFGILPLAVFQAVKLLDTFPEIWNSFINRLPENIIITQNQIDIFLNFLNITPGDIVNYVTEYLLVLTNGITFLIKQVYLIFVFIAQVVFGYIIAFYFMSSIRGFVKGLINLIEVGDKKKNRQLILDMSKILFSYIRGVFIVSTLVAFLMTIGAYIIGIEAPIVFGLISGITNVIPYLGPVLGGIPLFIVALSLGYKQAFLSILLICLVQFIESNFFQPKIMSQATSLHPVTIMIGLLVFGSLFGIMGMVIATPVISIFNVWLKQSHLKNKIKI